MRISPEWVPRFDEMGTAVLAWRARIEQPPVFAERGSSLAKDDETYPDMPASAVAYNGILTAVEHLEFFFAALDATRTLYPAAHYTTLRTALMGSAQAVWVLAAGDRTVRRARALRIAVDDLHQERKMFPDIREFLPEDRHAAIDARIAELDSLLQKATAAAIGLNLSDTNVPKWTLNMTDVIRDAAEHVHGKGDENTDIRASTRLLWRTQSGHAHGVPGSRQRLVRQGDPVVNPDGTGWARAGTTIEDVGVAAGAATLLTSEAWRLYDLRTQAR